MPEGKEVRETDLDMTDAQLQRIEDLVVDLGKTGARHEKWLESIDAKFGTLNGTVAALTKDSIEAKIFQAEHARTVDKIEALELDLNNKSRERDKQLQERDRQLDDQISSIKDNFRTEQEVSIATQRTNEKFRNAFKPWIDRLTIAVVVLVLWNGRDILETLARAFKGVSH